MRHINGFSRFWLLLGLAMLPQAVQASENQQDTMWIIGSYVNVREGADDKARVIDHLTTNSKVSLSSENARYCEIKWGEGRHGYVVCRYLARKPLQISDVERTEFTASDEHLEESPLRAFWIEPSYQRLSAAGSYFEKVMLSSAAVAKESDQLKTWVEKPSEKAVYFTRFSVPEFDAMKTVAKNGIQPPRLISPVYTDIKSLRQKTFGSPMADDYLPLLEFLPTLAGSRFSTQEQVGSMQTTTDKLSALFQIPYKVESVSKPYAVSPHYNDPYIFGSWDIGDVNLSLVRPVHDVGIYRDGHVKDVETNLNEWDGYYADYELVPECGNFIIDAHLHDEASGNYIISKLPSKGLLMYYRTPTVMDTSPAQIQTKTLEVKSMPKRIRDALQKTETQQVVQYTITLKGDTSPDFVVFELMGYSNEPGIETGNEGPIYPTTRYYFINIGGEWKLFDADGLTGCS